jgi:hypothetical protein
VDKQEKMAITRIQVCWKNGICQNRVPDMARTDVQTFYSKSADMVEVATVYVGIDSEKASHNGPDGVTEGLGEGNAYQGV